MPTLPVSASYVNGNAWAATDVNAYGNGINALYDYSYNKLAVSAGDLLVGSGVGTAAKLAVSGTTGYVLIADTTVGTYKMKWGQVPTAGIENLAITSAKIATNTVTSDNCQANGAAKSIFSVGTALTSAASSKIHFKTTSGAPTTGGSIGDIWFVTA
jgi:hypothetical protein